MNQARTQAFTHLSRHALVRLRQRTKLRARAVEHLLDRGLYVDTGRKPGFDRHHLVFYSKPDDRCYVAVRDQSCGTVVTILPLDFQANLAWPVSTEHQIRARALAAEEVKRETQASKVVPAQSQKRFHISVAYLEPDGRRKVKLLFKIPSTPYEGSARRLLQDDEILARIDGAMDRAGISGGRVLEVIVRMGRAGEPTIIAVRTQANG